MKIERVNCHKTNVGNLFKLLLTKNFNKFNFYAYDQNRT